MYKVFKNKAQGCCTPLMFNVGNKIVSHTKRCFIKPNDLLQAHWQKLRDVLIRGYCTPKQKLSCFVFYLKIINTFMKNIICILQYIVQGTQKWHWNLRKPSSSWVIDQNIILTILIHDLKTAWSTKILMPVFSSFSTIYFKIHALFFKIFW